MRYAETMICNPHENGWELVYQSAHALLAAKLVTHWRHDERPERWTETLNAIAQHDNGWQEWESGTRLSAAGKPLDFRETPDEDVVSHAERVVTRAWHQSLWTGLLVSSHISHLHESRRGQFKPLDKVLDDQIDLRARWCRELGVTPKEVAQSYSLVQLADTFSLVLCMHHLPPDGRALEIGTGPDGAQYNARVHEDGAIQVDPWPYTVDSFTAGVDTYCLDQFTFKSDQDLSRALNEQPATTRTWNFHK